MGLLAGRTAIVTGAGRGVGREVALLMAAEGANVVVNDLGGGTDGTGRDARHAEAVAAEIEAGGGRAVANAGNVADRSAAEQMVVQALDSFGGLDIVVNNAGVLRDAIFHKMSEEEWDSVVGVNLKGSFNVSRAAAPHLRKQEWGRFIHMTSTSGLVGNFGQANYIAAKLGVAGLSRSIALDMARFNVTSNAVGPLAWTRLTETIPAETEGEKRRVERLKAMTPGKVAQLVAALASEAAGHVTGQIFISRGNEIFLLSQPRPVRGLGRLEGWTPQAILDHALPAFESAFTPLERSGDVFSWDPV